MGYGLTQLLEGNCRFTIISCCNIALDVNQTRQLIKLDFSTSELTLSFLHLCDIHLLLNIGFKFILTGVAIEGILIY